MQASSHPAITWLVVLVTFAVALSLFTRDNTYPFYYHPDEPGKVRQVRKATRNFNHPQLLLNTVSVAANLTGARRSPQEVVVVGRWVSAIFAAAAAALLAIAVVWLAGPAAGLAAGLLIASTPLVTEAAHHFKEDAVFIFGFAACTAAIVTLDRRPNRTSICALGLALALAASAKYVGILLLPVGLLFLHRKISRAPGEVTWSARRSVGTAFGVFALAMAAINYQILFGLADFVTGLGSEIQKVQEQPTGVSERIPNSYLWRAMLRETPVVILVFAVLGLLSPAFQRRRPRSVEIAIVLMPGVYWIATSFSGKVALRYFDPLAAMLAALAAVGLGRTAALVASRIPAPAPRRCAEWVVVIAGGVWMISANLPALAELQADFRTDTRRELARFIIERLPASAVIAQDKQVKLPNESRPDENVQNLRFAQKILSPSKLGPVADLGTLDALRSRGVTHIAVAESDWGIYFSAGEHTTGWDSPATAQRVAFYRQLFKQGKRLWEARAGKTAYVRQGLILFDVRPAP